MMTKNIRSRIEKLENTSIKNDVPLWVIAYSDDDEIPEGVKAYHPNANPDMWDDDFEDLNGVFGDDKK